MDSAGDDDPDPGGSHRPTLFYGLWPRFAPRADAGDQEDAGLPAEAEAVADA
jgi:hypothetical protein